MNDYEKISRVSDPLVINLGLEARSIIEYYCGTNQKSVSEAITNAIKLLKIADDSRYRGEFLGIFKIDADENTIFIDQIKGY